MLEGTRRARWRRLLLMAAIPASAMSHATQVEAQEVNNIEHLHRGCQMAERRLAGDVVNDEQSAGVAYCLGYLKAMHDVFSMNCVHREKGDANKNVRATDPNIAPRALVKSFVKWANENPRFWDQPETLAYIPLVSDYPCRN